MYEVVSMGIDVCIKREMNLTLPLAIELVEKMAERVGNIDGCADFKEHLSAQRHLDAGTPERAYWHAGYASALKDILRTLRGAGDSD
jgi:hypothetical protein